MSHFTYFKTRFQNRVYLEIALKKLKLPIQKHPLLKNSKLTSNTPLVIPQSNGYDITFNWNGREYELVTDLSFWAQKQPLEIFLDKITQQYACELIIHESQKIGFQQKNYEIDSEGCTKLTLNRWSVKNN